MQLTVYSAKPFDREFFARENEAFGHDLTFLEPRLTAETAPLAAGAGAVCPFVNDSVDAAALEVLAEVGTKLIALRSAGFNHVDLAAADRLGLTVVRVPAYSPHAVAEHTIALILSLNRKIPRARDRIREGNFALDGLMGFDLHGKTAGVIGTGKIGAVVARILLGFGCHVLAADTEPDKALLAEDVEYVAADELASRSDLVTLHCPLTPDTRHLVDAAFLDRMKPGAMLINTSRGALIDTRAVIDALKTRRLGSLGIDVYEEEADLFFEDHSSDPLTDDVFARLLTFPNVLVTGHQAFFTREAVTAIARTTLQNVTDFERTGRCSNAVRRN
ncbi:2-hydroxyacid dehydrogenase [Alienimonas chondri]|uniref:D-lactate dehydrogenase n=1 Tax=Alienimonas chondri TaxID=2681879 RepID=A0ABX1VCS7_9PLAN|nr:2-hydroxyacid dehydrogenase [Alienimonas chondri]NNJ25915.1 D-lactate dehydrogenase [Alienimonas chondri]